MKKELTVADIREINNSLNRLPDDIRLVIPIKTMGVTIGGTPSVNITGIYNGCDWDRGKLFFASEEPLQVAGDVYYQEREKMHKIQEALGFLWLNLTNTRLDDKQKIMAAKGTLRQFGFNIK